VGLNVYYLTFTKFNFDNNVKVEDRIKDDECLGGGKYCARPFYSEENFNPKAVLKENLLQKCIFLNSKSTNSTGDYLNYMANFYDNCFTKRDVDTKKNKFSVECGRVQMDESDIDIKEVDKCYAQSFNFDENSRPIDIVSKEETLDNNLFDADNKMRSELNVKIMPSIFINRKQFWGAYEINAILEAICSGLLKKPEACYSEGFFVKQTDTRKFWKFFLFVLAIVMGISLIIFIVCRKYMTNQVTDKLSETDIDLKVNTVVTSYLALKDKN